VDGHLERPPGLHRGEIDGPGTVLIGNRGCAVRVEFHADLFARFGPTPDVDRLIALQEHMVTEDDGQRHGPMRCGEAAQERDKAKRPQASARVVLACGRAEGWKVHELTPEDVVMVG
jgi:hypothetical protein